MYREEDMKCMKWLRTPKFHLALVIAWALLLVPTVLWWKESILWVAAMSLYANVASHWSAYQGARAERAEREDQDGTDEEL